MLHIPEMIEDLTEDIKQDLNTSSAGMIGQWREIIFQLLYQRYGRCRVKEYFFWWKKAKLDIDPVGGNGGE